MESEELAECLEMGAEEYIEHLRDVDRKKLELLLRQFYCSTYSRKRDREEIKALLERALVYLD